MVSASPREGNRVGGWQRAARASALVACLAAAPLPSTAAVELSEVPGVRRIQEMLRGKRHAEAAEAARALLAEREAATPSDSAGIAEALDLLVEASWRGGKAKSAETLALGERAVVVKARTGDEVGLAYSLGNLGVIHDLRGESEAARCAHEEALAIQERVLGREHPALARTLNDLSMLEVAAGRPRGAIPLLERAADILEKTTGRQRGNLAVTLDNLAFHQRRIGDREGEERTRLRHLAAALERGECDVEVGHALFMLGVFELRLGRREASRKCSAQALEIFEAALGSEDVTVAETLNNLAIATRDQDPTAAAAMDERALAIRLRLLGPDAEEVARSLHGLGTEMRRLGRLDEAERLLRQSLAIRLKASGPFAKEVASTLNNLGNVLRDRGNLREAVELLEGAAAIGLAQDPPDPETPTMLVSLSSSLWAMGDRGQARREAERALALEIRLSGEHHPRVATILGNLATARAHFGDFASARSLHERALAIAEAVHGSESLATVPQVQELAAFLASHGAVEEARELHERAVRIFERSRGPGHSDTIAARADLAMTLRSLGRDDATSRQWIEEALHDAERRLPAGDRRLARRLKNLGLIQRDAGDVGGARLSYDRAVGILENALGPEHPDVAEALESRASLLGVMESWPAALEDALRADRIHRATARLAARQLSEREALHLSGTTSTALDLALSIVVDHLPGETSRSWTSVIRSRASVLHEMASRHRAVVASRDPRVAGLASRLAIARERLSHLVNRGPVDITPLAHRGLLDAAVRDVEAAERVLAEASSAVRAEAALEHASLEDVQAALPPGSALVAFRRFDHHFPAPPRHSRPSTVDGTPAGPWTSHRLRWEYLAFVARAGSSPAEVIPLGSARDIEDLVAAWRGDVLAVLSSGRVPSSEVTSSCRAHGEALRKLIWDPIETHVVDADRVVLVPDGALSLVDFAALPTAAGRFLVEDGPRLVLLDSERDLIGRDDQRKTAGGLLAVGAPDFGALGASAPPTVIASRSAAAQDGPGDGCGDLRSLAFPALQRATQEAEEVAALWRIRHAGDSEAVVLTGPRATEEAFRREASGKRVVHVATHGFFLGAACPRSHEATWEFVPEEPLRDRRPTFETENPVLLAGLAFAGANRRLWSVSGDDDGILTADEIASLDLSAADLVVLSACDTGVGDSRAGEGLMGLRRAFRVAGARALVVSLWPVSDDGARAWMTSVYRSRVLEGRDLTEASREASLAALGSLRSRGLPAHPGLWARFIVTGEWR